MTSEWIHKNYFCDLLHYTDYMIINKEKVTVKCQHQIRFRIDRSVGDQVDALRHIDGGLSIKWLDPICIIVYKRMKLQGQQVIHDFR